LLLAAEGRHEIRESATICSCCLAAERKICRGGSGVWRGRTAEGFCRAAAQLPSVAALGAPISFSAVEEVAGRGRDGAGVFEIGNFGIDVCHESSRRAEANAVPPSKTPHACVFSSLLSSYGHQNLRRTLQLTDNTVINVENVEDKVKALLERIEDGKVVDGNDVADLSKRKLIVKHFWDFDALFQPQQHPARDSHDAFFRKDYAERVKLVHESGGYGSKRYGYDWKGKKLIKISFEHTTAVSTRMLCMLAQQVFSTPRLRIFFAHYLLS
ncbi:hypothetical protein MUK42_34117, partial [Musa troglodytarum]